MSKAVKKVKRPRQKKVDPNHPLKLPTPWVIQIMRNTHGALDLPADELPLDHAEGFVYLITNTVTGRQYIGKKFLWSHTRVKVAGRQNRKRKVTESNWRHYKSSCEELKNDIVKQGLQDFRFEILQFFKTRKETNYAELAEQVKRDVLTAKLPDGSDAYYNANILNRYFK